MKNKYLKPNKSANSLMWVEYWIEHVDPSKKIVEITADELDDGKWKCEIELPLINKTIKSISSTEVNAMKNACDRASRLIEDYMSKHPELVIHNMFKGQEYIFEEDEYGRFVSAGLSHRARKKNITDLEKMNSDSIKIVQEMVKKLTKVYKTDKNLFVQVIDQSMYDDEKTIPQILNETVDKLEKDFNLQQSAIYYDKDSGKVISIGFSSPKPFIEELQ